MSIAGVLGVGDSRNCGAGVLSYFAPNSSGCCFVYFVQHLLTQPCCRIWDPHRCRPSRFNSTSRGPLFAFWQPFTQPLQLD